jgi:hypothetical protein
MLQILLLVVICTPAFCIDLLEGCIGSAYWNWFKVVQLHKSAIYRLAFGLIVGWIFHYFFWHLPA